MPTDDIKFTDKEAQGCVLLAAFSLFALFGSIGVGFIFGAGYGFLTAAAVALVAFFAYAHAFKKKARKDADQR